MNLIPRHLCRICGDQEELERCRDVLNITIMNMGHVQNHMHFANSMTQPMPNAMAQPMISPTQDASNPYRQYQSSYDHPYRQQQWENAKFFNPYLQPVGLTGQHSPMYLSITPNLQWGDGYLDVAAVTGDINDIMFLVEPILKMFKGLKAAYRSTSPLMNDFTILDDDNIFDEELYVWGHCVPAEQLKSFSAKLAAVVITGKEDTYTFPGILMKYSDLTDDLKITNIPEGIGIMRYRRSSRQQRIKEEEKRRTPFWHNPMDPQDIGIC